MTQGEWIARTDEVRGRVLTLAPGERRDIAPPRVHHVANAGAGEARYLLVQGVGPYDFEAVD